MLLSAVLSLTLCSGVLATQDTDTTAYVQKSFLDIFDNPVCPSEKISAAISVTHQHSETCSHGVHHYSHNTTSTSIASLPDPWTVRPACSENTTTQFCVFTTTAIHDNRGLSIITKPEIARLMARSPVFSLNSKPVLSSLSENDPRAPPYIVAAVPGKGMGVVATRTIERGDLIKAHPAIAIFHNSAVEKDSPQYVDHHGPLRELAVKQLPPASQDLFMSMAAHNESEEPIIERIYTNTFGEDFGGEEHSIVVPETARLNHDCRPNAMYYFDPKTLMHYTHASRTIYAGEEITITYIDPLQTRLRRRAAIRRSWGFECSCSSCSQEQHFVAESNRRIVQINKLSLLFNETGMEEKRVGGSPGLAELLVALYEQERLWGSMVWVYRMAALSHAAAGREWEALKWGFRALDAGLIDSGPMGMETRDMKRLVNSVRKHWSWELNI